MPGTIKDHCVLSESLVYFVVKIKTTRDVKVTKRFKLTHKITGVKTYP
jgi:hypothetical protein